MLFTEFAQRIKKVYMIAGQNLPESFEIICKDIYDRIPKELTDGEIEYVLAEGVFKKFGNYEFIKPVLIHEWFQIFRTSDYRQQLFPKQQLQLESSTQLTPDELRKSSIKHFIDCFNEYREKGYIDDFGGCIYNFLKREGKLNFSQERESEFMESAKRELINKTNNSPMINEFAKTMKVRNIVNEITKTKNKIPAVSVIYQKLVVNDFFKNMVQMDISPNEITNETNDAIF